MKRVLLIIAGVLLLGIGVIGVILPILPSFPFFLLTSVCFLKSSTKLDAWFRNTKMYKKHVARIVQQRGLTLKSKLCILIPVSAMLITLCFLYDNLAMRIVISVLLGVKIIVFIKIKTIKEENVRDVKQAANISVCKK